MYETSYVPEGWPGGGGFSVIKFTLDTLYTMFEKCQNWWTSSNDNLPLSRYLGCRLKCYQSTLIDYVIRYSNNLQAVSNKLTYPSTQPSIMLMAKNKIVVPSRETKQLRKQYKKIYIPPPSLLENKWYMTKDISSTPLLVLHTAPCSLQKYYVDPDWDSNNITLNLLNTVLVQNTNFTENPWAFKRSGTIDQYFYYHDSDHTTPNQSDKILLKELIPLTLNQWTLGESCATYLLKNRGQTYNQYIENWRLFQGCPFMYEHLKYYENWYYSTWSPATLMSPTVWTKENQTVGETKTTQHQTMTLTHLINDPLFIKARYNPLKDDGKSTKMYLVPNNKAGGWTPPTNPDFILDGFPMWLNIWGFTDFQKRLEKLTNIENGYILVIENTTTDPKRTSPMVVIDLDMINNRSPYSSTVHPDDAKRWYPQLQYQTQQMNTIAKCGLGTPKLPDKTSEQVTVFYDFMFKWGGEPAKMITVDNPTQQPVFPVPHTELQTPSLQSPAQAFETCMYTFDQRNQQITRTALERIKKDWDFTKLISSFTEPGPEVPVQQTFQTPQDQTQTTEKEKEALLQQLLDHQLQQQQLRLGILQLMQTMHM